MTPTPEYLRIFIAENLGFKRIGLIEGSSELMGELPPTRGWIRIPDYPNDLNAMHEAEKLLLDGVKCTDDVVAGTPSGDYFMRLSDVTERDDHMMFTATAAQRAEAFYLTLTRH
jgi:hypothetical protein